MFCTCDWSKLSAQIWRLPKLTRKIEDAFNITRCPLGWFKPHASDARIEHGRIIKSIAPNVEGWLARVRKAEDFWREYGPLFGFGFNNKEPA